MLRLAVLGTGSMAKYQMQNFKKIKGIKFTACCDVSGDASAKFAEEHQILNHYCDLKEMLAKEQIDAITNVTSDTAHYPTSMEIIRKKVHLLCEKPLATNARDAAKMADAAKKAGIINMINLTYRNAASLQKAAQIIAAGGIGDIRHIEMSYLQPWLATPSLGAWRNNPALIWRLCSEAGSKGVLGDLGVHIFDFATFAAGPHQKT